MMWNPELRRIIARFETDGHRGHFFGQVQSDGCTALSPWLVGAVTLGVTITMLVYHFMLAPRMFAMQSDYRPFTTRDILIHYATPLSVILDWLLFVPKGRYRWRGPFSWLLLSLGYLAFALVRAEVGGPLPGGGAIPTFPSIWMC